MMKFFTLALALVAATTFVSAEYTCHNEAFFQVKDVTKPSEGALESLQSAMVDSFEEAYKNNPDIDMLSDKFDSFDIGPDATSVLSTLRGGKLLGYYKGRWISQGWWGCNYCEIDDDATLGASIDGPEFGVALTTSSEHKLWEKLFCAKAREYKEFSSISGCTIVLTDCHNANYQSEFDMKGNSFVDQATKLVMNSN